MGLAFAGSDETFDLYVRNGVISAIVPASGAATWLCTPPLADLHVHANRAFTPPRSRPRGLDDAVSKVAGLFSSFESEDYEHHARMLIDAAYRHATTRLRTHADIDPVIGLKSVAGSIRAGEVYRESVEVEVVAFASASADPATAEGKAMLRDAIQMGAGFIGAVPAFCADQTATIDAVLELAVECDVPVDLHLDEHLQAERCASGYLAAATLERGLQGRVTIGHACAVSMLPTSERRQVIDALAEARITVIALPRTNLYLQDATTSLPLRRGLTPVGEMLASGVSVRFASDNVRDAFFPYGDADLLGVAMDGILASHVDDPVRVIAAICDGRTALAVGDPADMVLLPGESLDAILAQAPSARWVVRGGSPELVSGAVETL